MDPSNDPIREYMRVNKDRLTREAMRKQLIAAGHDPARVDVIAKEEWQASSLPVTRDGEKGPINGLNLLARVLYIIGALVGALGAFLVASLSGMSGPDYLNASLFLLIYAVAYLGLGYLVVRIVRWGVPQFQIRGLGAALLGLLLIPVYGGLMFGTCVAAYGVATGGN